MKSLIDIIKMINEYKSLNIHGLYTVNPSIIKHTWIIYCESQQN